MTKYLVVHYQFRSLVWKICLFKLSTWASKHLKVCHVNTGMYSVTFTVHHMLLDDKETWSDSSYSLLLDSLCEVLHS